MTDTPTEKPTDAQPQKPAEAAPEKPAEPPAPPPVFLRSKHLSYFEKGTDIYLHQDLTGDILRLDPALIAFIDYFAEPHTAADASAAFAEKFEDEDLQQFLSILPHHRCLVLAGEDELVALDDWVPVIGPWSLLNLPANGDVEVAYVDRRSDEVVIERLDLVEAGVVKRLDGERTVKQIWTDVQKELSDTPGVPERARRAIYRLTHSDRQVLKLAREPLSVYREKPRPPYLDSTMPFKRLRGAAPVDQGDVATTRDYHRSAIDDADEQFEVRETTLSHAFREPHPALAGKTYGGRLAKVLLERELLVDEPVKDLLRIVEVGGGTGLFATCFLDGLAVTSPRLYHRARYTVVDIAPTLQKSQRERTAPHREKVRLLRGDAVTLPFASESVDLLLSNEMIADLETARVRQEDLQGHGRGATAVHRYRLPVDDAPHEFWVNAGACDFLAEVKRVLKPGGRAIVTEFGERDRYPVESTHLDHREFSIHFGHLLAAAATLGLEARLEEVPDLLDMDLRVPVVATNRSFFVALRALLARSGVPLKKTAYTAEALTALAGTKIDLTRLVGLRFQPCGERVLGLRPREFKALLLERPRSGGPREPVRRTRIEF